MKTIDILAHNDFGPGGVDISFTDVKQAAACINALKYTKDIVYINVCDWQNNQQTEYRRPTADCENWDVTMGTI